MLKRKLVSIQDNIKFSENIIFYNHYWSHFSRLSYYFYDICTYSKWIVEQSFYDNINLKVLKFQK